MQVTFKNVGARSLTWTVDMNPPTEQKMLAAIAHRGALLSRNITLEHDISNDQKFAICAGARVVGLIYLGNALAVEQAREQSVESAQPLSSNSTAQPQPDHLDMLAESSAAVELSEVDKILRYHLDDTGRIPRGQVEIAPSNELLIHPADELRIRAEFQARGWHVVCVDRTARALDEMREAINRWLT